MSLWNDPFISELFLSRTPLIDVRAPIEFLEGSIPNSVNLPLMNNEERHLVGLCYREHGQARAIELGHQLVSGTVKEKRIQAWIHFLQRNPSAQVFCFRGGLRSQISCKWITENGIERRPVPGGYKKLRQFLLSWLNEAPLPEMIRLGGMTGAGKTKVLKSIPHYVDIEALANHRGSAFGKLGNQPSQTTFENQLAFELLTHPQRMILEDETVTLGKLHIPHRFYLHMRQSKLVVMEVPMEERVANIHCEYVLKNNAEFFLNATVSISRKLGGKRAAEILTSISDAFDKGLELQYHQSWITQLLSEYYDPLYQKDLMRQSKLITFIGKPKEVQEYLSGTF